MNGVVNKWTSTVLRGRFSLSSVVGSGSQVAQWLAFLISPMRSSAGTGLKSKRKVRKKILPGLDKCSQSESSCWDDLGIWNDTVGRGRQQLWALRDCCAVHFKQQSLKSARAISSQYFTCKGERKEGRRSPMLLLRQGRRQTGPASSKCALQGSDARTGVLCSPCGRPTRSGPRKAAPHTADTCSSSSSSAENPGHW